MTQEQKSAFEAVDKINNELFKKYCRTDLIEYLPVVSITFANHYTFINLSIVSDSEMNIPEILLFNSTNDDRIYYEKSDKYETYYKFIKRKFNRIKKEINSVKL